MQIIKLILSPILFPLSLLYGFIVFVRNRLYDWNIFKSTGFDIPIISVGNITAGGTGKTPHIEYLVNLLKSDFEVATLSRGYKRDTRGFVHSSINSTANEIGDEPKLIKQKFPEVDVAVDAERVNGINRLLKINKDLNVILLDDAFQHRKVNPGLSILLIDYNRPIFRDFILPMGMLREYAFEKKRADIILVTKCPEELCSKVKNKFIKKLKPCVNQQVLFNSFEYGEVKTVFDNSQASHSYKDLKNFTLLILTGIANPKPLIKHIEEKISKSIITLKYSDHYSFRDDDIGVIQKKFKSIDTNKKIIITTEKDAVRLQKFSNIESEFKKAFYYIPIKVKFLNSQSSSFNEQIIEYVEKNRTNSSFPAK